MTAPSSPMEQLVEVPDTHRGTLQLSDPAYTGDPTQVFRQLRQTYGPLAPVLLHGDVPAWLVLGHRELHHVVADPVTFARSSQRWRLADQLPDDWPLWPMVGGGQAIDSLLYCEGEHHQQRAEAMAQALASVDLTEFRARCERFGDQLLERFAGRGEADLMADFAQQLPVWALGWALGVAPTEYDGLVTGFTRMLSGGPDAIAGQQQARDIITRVVAATPPIGSSVTAHLAAHPAGLTASQQVEDLMVAIIAGHQTTAYWMGNAMRLMLTDTRFADTLTRGRLPVSHALSEVLWEDTPTQIFAGRWTSRAVDLGRFRIPAGDMVLLGLAAANGDPHIRRPDGTMRGSRAYASFSAGPHGCPTPARRLAEIITGLGVELLLDRLPDMQITGDLTWQPGVWMRGLQQLPVSFSPAPSAQLGLGGVPWT